MSDPDRIEECEQAFLPKPELIEAIRASREAEYNIVQAYFPSKESAPYRCDINFLHDAKTGKPAEADVIFRVKNEVVLSSTARNPTIVQALFDACQDADVKKELINSVRIRVQKMKGSKHFTMYLTLKGHKDKDSGGTTGPEYEFGIEDQLKALQFMHHYGREHLLHKSRFVKHIMVAGKERCFELDYFHGQLKGKGVKKLFKLEIEHESKADLIMPEHWQEFALQDVTGVREWKSRNLAGFDTHARAELKNLITEFKAARKTERYLEHIAQNTQAPSHSAKLAARQQDIDERDIWRD